MPRHRVGARRILVTILLTAAVAAGALVAGQTRGASWAPCNEFLVPKKQVQGRQIGQERCLMQEESFGYRGKQFRRVDLRISGTTAGYSVTDQPTRVGESGGMVGTMTEYFNSAPEFAFAQFGQMNSLPGVARYEGSAGVGVDVFYPAEGTAWNGKLYFGVTGTGLCTWSRPGRVRTDSLSDVSGLYRLMLDKGYAVAVVAKSAGPSPPGDAPCAMVTLDSGIRLENMNFTDHPDIHLEFVKLAKSVLKTRLGKEPSRTYWYGKSSGSRLGRLVNYKPGLNLGDDGKPLIDGFFQDDAATGLWLPVLFDDGKDVLFAGEADRERFAKQIDITHQLYVHVRTHPLPDWVSPIYTINKRNNAKLLRDKGLGPKHRMYEVKGVSHSGGELIGDPGETRRRRDPEVLNLAWLWDGIIDLLDAWVDKSVEPPPTRSDWLELGDISGDGSLDHAAVALPEVACPLGVYYPYPPSAGGRGVGSTAFAYFDGKSLEPMDGRGVFVDMNLNGYPDLRENLTQAWRRLGLLRTGETFSRDRYVNCVRATAGSLKNDGLITERGVAVYLEEATKAECPSNFTDR